VNFDAKRDDVDGRFHLHPQPRKQLYIILRHAQFQQHDAVYTLAQVFGDRRPRLGSCLAGGPEV